MGSRQEIAGEGRKGLTHIGGVLGVVTVCCRYQRQRRTLCCKDSAAWSGVFFSADKAEIQPKGWLTTTRWMLTFSVRYSSRGICLDQRVAFCPERADFDTLGNTNLAFDVARGLTGKGKFDALVTTNKDAREESTSLPFTRY